MTFLISCSMHANLDVHDVFIVLGPRKVVQVSDEEVAEEEKIKASERISRFAFEAFFSYFN